MRGGTYRPPLIFERQNETERNGRAWNKVTHTLYAREDMLTNANNKVVNRDGNGAVKYRPLKYRNGTIEKTCQNRLSNDSKP